MICVNERCSNDPLNSMHAIVVTVDGDMACCPACKKAYEGQRDTFFDNVGDNAFYENWLSNPPERKPQPKK